MHEVHLFSWCFSLQNSLVHTVTIHFHLNVLLTSFMVYVCFSILFQLVIPFRCPPGSYVLLGQTFLPFLMTFLMTIPLVAGWASLNPPPPHTPSLLPTPFSLSLTTIIGEKHTQTLQTESVVPEAKDCLESSRAC